MCKWKSTRSGSWRAHDVMRKQAGLRLRLETWAVSVTFLVLIAITVSQSLTMGH
ncbi:hypothetical protein QFZ65_000768 [Arthrobacter sp. B3I9]|nr:hypothetical protein [Arthrobacter sp. B3I9]